MIEKILLDIIRKNPQNRNQFDQLKQEICAKNNIPQPSNQKFIVAYKNLITQKKIKANGKWINFLKKRAVRTSSGIACITVITKKYQCPGRCAYCPTIKDMPKSYLPDEPAMMRAVLTDFDPYEQVIARLEALTNNGHSTDKIEIRIAGETWSNYPTKYQTWFIKRIFDALNCQRTKNLLTAQKLNEKAPHRCVGLSIETRPDFITEKEIKKLREFGVTLVELGVQHLLDKVLTLNQRDHGVKETIQATKLLRSAGFKIVYHTMPNLYGSNPKKDFDFHQKLFTVADFQPDQLKIYPCILLKDTLLYHWYKQGKYQPYTEKQLINLLLKIKKIIPEYCRVIRVIRDIPQKHIVAGNKRTNLRQLLQINPLYQCRCIRCREPKEKLIDLKKIKLKTISYQVNQGTEYFISFETDDAKNILGFVRLYLPDHQENFLPILKKSALIRELHVYGQMAPILQKKNKKFVQHFGFGQKLMKTAEKIAQKNRFKKIAVIAGIGVRDYYRQKLGYKLKETYMVKNLG